MLTKEECIRRLKEARSTIQPYCYVNEALDYAIKELQNLPLKFEQLHEGMWVWDNKTKEYITCSPNINIMGQMCVCYWCGFTYLDGEFDEDYIIFEENRFFRNEVKE